MGPHLRVPAVFPLEPVRRVIGPPLRLNTPSRRVAGRPQRAAARGRALDIGRSSATRDRRACRRWLSAHGPRRSPSVAVAAGDCPPPAEAALARVPVPSHPPSDCRCTRFAPTAGLLAPSATDAPAASGPPPPDWEAPSIAAAAGRVPPSFRRRTGACLRAEPLSGDCCCIARFAPTVGLLAPSATDAPPPVALRPRTEKSPLRRRGRGTIAPPLAARRGWEVR